VAAEVLAKHDRLDVLLNNAGVLVTERRETTDGIEETLAVNHLGYFLLTTLLTDLLKKSAPARIVSVSSEAHRTAKMNWDDLQLKKGWSAMRSYSQSKLCNILFTRELARRLEGSRVTANCLHPGVIASGFGHTDGGLFSVLVSIARPFFITPEKGARTQVWLSSTPEVEGVTGKYFDKCKERTPNKAAQEAGAPERLWAISEELTGEGRGLEWRHRRGLSVVTAPRERLRDPLLRPETAELELEDIEGLDADFCVVAPRSQNRPPGAIES
jgi:retinol dehydrogenase-12